MELDTPQEPREVKDWIKMLAQKASGHEEINWDSLNVWYGNKLPKYLWNEWKGELSLSGFNWQKFLKLMSFRTDQIILWSSNKIPWENLVREIKEVLHGPLGKMIREAKMK